MSASRDDQDSSGTPLALVEGALFSAKEPVSYRRLAMLVGMPDATAARSAVNQINRRLDAECRAFRIEEVAGGVQMLTRKEFATWVRRRPEVPSEQLLSQAMLETLAIIAYRQPIVRAEIEAIRGVNCDEILRQLMQRNLVRIAGRDEELGRPYLYETTRTFLHLFGLTSLDNLPKLQKIRAAEAEIAVRLHDKPPGSQGTFLQPGG